MNKDTILPSKINSFDDLKSYNKSLDELITRIYIDFYNNLYDKKISISEDFSLKYLIENYFVSGILDYISIFLNKIKSFERSDSSKDLNTIKRCNSLIKIVNDIALKKVQEEDNTLENRYVMSNEQIARESFPEGYDYDFDPKYYQEIPIERIMY